MTAQAFFSPVYNFEVNTAQIVLEIHARKSPLLSAARKRPGGWSVLFQNA